MTLISHGESRLPNEWPSKLIKRQQASRSPLPKVTNITMSSAVQTPYTSESKDWHYDNRSVKLLRSLFILSVS